MKVLLYIVILVAGVAPALGMEALVPGSGIPFFIGFSVLNILAIRKIGR